MIGSTNRAISKLNSNELHFVRHNISLKENKIFFLFSQIGNQRFPTSLNNNIKSNFQTASSAWRNIQNDKTQM
jgi:hypothetical protein